MTLVQQLNDVYIREEWWQSHKESLAGITNYHQAMLDKGNIICYVVEGKLLGYCEFWRINFAQFGRLICHDKFLAPFENTTDGNIAYVANAWIDHSFRNTTIYKDLRNRFYALNEDCEYFVGEALRKKTQPIKVFQRCKIFIKRS